MWQLLIAPPGQDWQAVGTFVDLAEAADRIRRLESYPTTGIFFEFYIDALATDIEALSHFEHKGRECCYVILRRVP